MAAVRVNQYTCYRFLDSVDPKKKKIMVFSYNWDLGAPLMGQELKERYSFEGAQSVQCCGRCQEERQLL